MVSVQMWYNFNHPVSGGTCPLPLSQGDKNGLEQETQIMQYQFTQLRLDKEEFYNLIFMNTRPWWESEYHRKRNHSDPELTEGQQFLRKLCGKTLGEVVKKVTEKSGIDFRTEDITSTDVFEKLNMKAKHRRGVEESDPLV